MSNFTATAIERIATGSVIFIRDGFNAAAEVLAIDFEGDSYSVTYGTDDWSNVTTVRCGETVEAFNGQTFLRAEQDIPVEEWQAKRDALRAATDAMLAKLPAIHAETAAMQASMGWPVQDFTVPEAPAQPHDWWHGPSTQAAE